jgi:hypothetical protein
MEDTAGSAIDIPQWLQDVGREVNRLEAPSDYIRPPELELRLPILISQESSIREQLETWSTGVGGSEKARRKKGSRKRRKDDEPKE